MAIAARVINIIVLVVVAIILFGIVLYLLGANDDQRGGGVLRARGAVPGRALQARSSRSATTACRWP
ncbi:MAG: hypothetical protein WKF31_04400 [Thermoleophilaceae bacterium]